MIQVLNKEELIKIARDENQVPDRQTRNFLEVVANSLENGKTIQVRLQTSNIKKVLKIYKYDSVLYRFNLDSKITLS